MKPYGLRLDHHRYVLNDNGKHAPYAVYRARKKRERRAVQANDVGCNDCGASGYDCERREGHVCDCHESVDIYDMPSACDCADCLAGCTWTAFPKSAGPNPHSRRAVPLTVPFSTAARKAAS